jgi:phosphoglycerate dehydrogenase-like enzyme
MPAITVVHEVTWDAEEWNRLEALGPVRYTPGYPNGEEELVARIGDSEIAIGADVAFSAKVLAGCSRLRLLSLWSTGFNNVDLQAASLSGITVTNVPGYSAHSVAEHAWAMALHLLKRLGEADAHVRTGDFDWSAVRGTEVHGLTAGIIGVGNVGVVSATIARGVGCRVLGVTRRPDAARERAPDVMFVGLPELLAESDLIFVHVSLNESTRGLLDRHAFAAMARRPVLVNVSRGAVIEAPALLDALETGQLSGCGLDVLWDEPPDFASPEMRRLLAHPCVLLSPHCASHTATAFRQLTATCIGNVEAFLAGKPQNVVA